MCGILGIIGHDQVVQDLYDGLIVLQHRGQDAAGIMTYENKFHLKKGNGFVRDVFPGRQMELLKGNLGIGHVRYTTAGSFFDPAEAQPFYVNDPYGIALVHNGNLTNYDKLRTQVIKENKRHLNTNSDSEVLVNILADEIWKLRSKTLGPHKLFQALEKSYKRLTGSYSAVCIIAGAGLLGFRDPMGNRPLCLGKRKTARGEEYIVASESVALDALGFSFVSDVQPGEAVLIDLNYKIHRKQIVKPKWAPCLFEWVYLARPDSIIDKVSVYKARIRLGEFLAKKIKKAIDAGKVKIDVVIPVPDTSRPAAQAIAYELNLKYREGLIKNRYIGRTFIMAGQAKRKRSIKYKLNPIPLEIRGRNVLLVDDSIVRGNTSHKIIEMVRGAGAKKVYFASTAPALRNPCVYGVDLASRKEYVANGLTEAEICKAIGADYLFYQDLKDLISSVKKGNPNIAGFCSACFSGKYPSPEVTEKMLKKVELSRNGGFCDTHGDGIEEGQLSLL